MIKVCHIVNLITGKADGVYSHLKMIFNNYDKKNFEHFLVFQGGEKIEREVSELGVKVFVSTSLKKKFSIKAFIDIYKIIKSTESDVIHSHLLKPYVISGLINIFARRKLIFNYNGLFIHQNIYNGFLEKFIYQLFHFIIYLSGSVQIVLVPSKRSKALLLRETKLFPNPIVYYNGYRKTETQLTNYIIRNKLERIKSEGLIIGMISRLEIQKRIDRALELFKSIMRKRKDLFLIVFGDGSLKYELIEQAKSSGINSRVMFFDFVPEINSYYPYFDLLLFTSDYEGMPLSLWEAMSNGVPVVAPDVGGFKEILEENNCGLIYEPGNIPDAEDKLAKLLNNEPYRKRLGTNGRIAVESKYSEEKFIQQIEKVYSDLMTK